MAKYFTSNKLLIYLISLLILQPIVFKVFKIESSAFWSNIGHSVFILVGIILIMLHSKYRKENKK